MVCQAQRVLTSCRPASGCKPSPGEVTFVSCPHEATPMKAAKSDLTQRLSDLEDRFVDLWRTMSSLWGVSPTTAQIHGLLYITGQALSMDDIMERLGISRGNVSMNVNTLVEWGLVQRVHRRGDRRDYYESLSDVWEMFTLLAAQRQAARGRSDPQDAAPLPRGVVAGGHRQCGRRSGGAGTSATSQRVVFVFGAMDGLRSAFSRVIADCAPRCSC